MKFKDYIIGTNDLAFFAACVVFAALGIFLVLLTGTRLRDKSSPDSPQKFSWSYLWSDNARRIYASALATLLTLRFFTDITKRELTLFGALCIGLAWDSILLIIKQNTNWLDPKK